MNCFSHRHGTAFPVIPLLLVIFSVGALPCLPLPVAHAGDSANDSAAIVERVREDIRYLASDELEGRGIETEGIRKAADYIISEFKKAGVEPGMPDGTWEQKFDVPLGETVVGESTAVSLNGPGNQSIVLKAGETFQPLRRGKNGESSGPLVFIGYGISAEEDEGYDDYADIDVAGRILVMIRREPRFDGKPDAFRGTATSPHAYIDTKLKLAAERNAAGILFVNDVSSTKEAGKDELTAPSGFGTNAGGLPFAHVSQSVIDELLSVAPLKSEDGTELKSLAAVSDYIDANHTPVSQVVTGWVGAVATWFEDNAVETSNLIGVVRGEGPLADEIIVVGGHYDHLGYGGYGSRSPNRTGEIHNGADDNATGTAAVMEVARRVAAGPPPQRTIVFIAFSAEERGLIGSNFYVRDPVFSLDKTVAMLNYDMIGTLRNNAVEVNGVGTALEFAAIADAAGEGTSLDLTMIPHPFAGSDHLPFVGREIPVMFCFTGITDRYHTPDDDFEMINVEGTVRVIDYTENLLRGIDQLKQRPTYQEISRARRRPRQMPYLGVRPDFAGDADQPGVLISGVSEDSPAAAAELQVGDVLTKWNDRELKSLQNMMEALRDSKPGDEIQVEYLREGQAETATITLGDPR